MDWLNGRPIPWATFSDRRLAADFRFFRGLRLGLEHEDDGGNIGALVAVARENDQDRVLEEVDLHPFGPAAVLRRTSRCSQWPDSRPSTLRGARAQSRSPRPVPSRGAASGRPLTADSARNGGRRGRKVVALIATPRVLSSVESAVRDTRAVLMGRPRPETRGLEENLATRAREEQAHPETRRERQQRDHRNDDQVTAGQRERSLRCGYYGQRH
jgi:hypothetical protein